MKFIEGKIPHNIVVHVVGNVIGLSKLWRADIENGEPQQIILNKSLGFSLKWTHCSNACHVVSDKCVCR